MASVPFCFGRALSTVHSQGFACVLLSLDWDLGHWK